MKWVKMMLLSVVLSLAPAAAFAGLISDLLGRLTGGTTFDQTRVPAVPEPSGAIVMGVALITVALVARARGK